MPAPRGSGTTYTYQQLEQLWLSAGGSRALAPVMAAIAEAESGGNPQAYNSSGASGLWQILGNPFPGNPFDPVTNARMAVAKYRSQGLGAWTTYTSGAYKKFLQGGKGITSAVVHGAQAFLDEAEKFIGTPYQWGGDKPGGFDCSGLVYYALQQIGIKNPPRTSEEQWAWVQHVPQSRLAPGDLVFLNFPGESSPGHVMIWKGNNTVIQAPSTGQDVQYTHFDPGTTPQAWGAQLVGFGRVPGIGSASETGGGGGSGSSGGGGAGQQATLTSYTPPPWAAALGPGGDVLWSLFSNVSSLTGIMQPLADIANTVKRAEEAVAWFFVPSHWVRIICGIFGTGLVIGGLVIMTRTGKSTAVVAAGDVPLVMPGGEIAPALAIGQITVGAILLFVAFHNLPANVTDFGGFVSHLQGQLQNQGKAAS